MSKKYRVNFCREEGYPEEFWVRENHLIEGKISDSIKEKEIT